MEPSRARNIVGVDGEMGDVRHALSVTACGLATHAHDWDQLTYATAGVLRVSTADASWVVPAHRAVWVPAGGAHAEQMFAPVSVRTLYFAPRIAKTLPRECRTLNISSLLRELILIGYSSVSAFIAVFKKAFGATPSRYAAS